MTDGSERSAQTHYTPSPGYTGTVVEIPLAPCCRTVFLGEVCGCLEAVMAPDLPPILLDLRRESAVA